MSYDSDRSPRRVERRYPMYEQAHRANASWAEIWSCVGESNTVPLAYRARLHRQSLRSLADGPPRKPRRCGRARGTVESRWPEALRWERSNEARHHQGPPEPAKLRLAGEDRASTAPRGLRCQTKERGSSPPGTMRRAFAALASGGTVGSRWPEGLRRQRSNETRHHPEGAPRIRGEFIFVCRGAL
jgi:hypothetical protein